RPELIGGRVKKWHLSNQERALHSIGARKVRRDGRGWVWRLDDSDGSATEPGTISRPPGDGRGREFGLSSHARARNADNLFWRHHVSPGPRRTASPGPEAAGGGGNVIQDNICACCRYYSEHRKRCVSGQRPGVAYHNEAE